MQAYYYVDMSVCVGSKVITLLSLQFASYKTFWQVEGEFWLALVVVVGSTLPITKILLDAKRNFF